MGGFENSFGGAMREHGNLSMPFAPGGNGPVAGPFLMKKLAELLDFCGIRRNTRCTHERPRWRESVAEGSNISQRFQNFMRAEESRSSLAAALTKWKVLGWAAVGVPRGATW